MKSAEHLRHYLNYLIPREIVMPVVLVFSLEHVLEGHLTMLVPEAYIQFMWDAIFLVALLLTVYWGEVDEDKEEFEDTVEDEW